MHEYDQMEHIHNSLIQHGTANRRIYLMKSDFTMVPQLFEHMEKLAAEQDYTKLFIKAPEKHQAYFLEHGCVEEARIPAYYDQEACVFLGKFLDPQRRLLDKETGERMAENLKLAQERAPEHDGLSYKPQLDDSCTLRKLEEQDCAELARLYRLVFKSYPFPIFEEDYLKKTMQEHIMYFGVFQEGVLIAAASSEMDTETRSVELTDFATNPAFRGKSLAGVLLHSMEKAMEKEGMRTLYTIARALSPGMNISFARAGYTYGGTLINNTDISGNIESMNVWYRSVA